MSVWLLTGKDENDNEMRVIMHYAKKGLAASKPDDYEKRAALKKKEIGDRFQAMIEGIHKTKSIPGSINWENLRLHNPKKYARLMKLNTAKTTQKVSVPVTTERITQSKNG